MIEKNISLFIENQFPDNFKNDGPLLVKFIEYYYQWMEETGNVTDITRKIPDYSDPDLVPEQFFAFLKQEFMSGIPENLVVDQKILLKNILDFYRTRGTEASYRLLFRILFNVEIKFYYPGDDILRVSDGRWTIERYLSVVDINPTVDYTLIAEVMGSISKAKARVERIEEFFDLGFTQYRLYLTNVFGTFQAGEDIVIAVDNSYYCKNMGTLFIEDGKYIGTYGQVSSNKRLQDNLYYQEYSYEIQSSIDILKYETIVKDLVHPAGTKLFGKVLSEFEISSIYFIADLDYENTIEFGNNDGNGIIINVTNLEVFEGSVIDNASILDFNIQETIGTGLVSINDGQISDFNDFTIAEFGLAPVSVIGSRKLIVGTGTSFTSEIGQPAGAMPGTPVVVIKIDDTDNSFMEPYDADTSYSNRLFTITEDYFYPLFTLEAYNLVRSVSANNIITDYRFSNTSLGTGTVAVSGTLVTGTGTNFSNTITSGDIMEVKDSVNGNTFAFVFTVTSNTSITLNEDYKWGSANTSSYKIYEN